ncbi:kinase-like domain-containing protein, partial [Mrakia frigida]|uniref:kinase-like domain-containing protein n=1 Tax=Mrakia frigida TaxID=29902 RepID=UPI003FCC0208
GHDLNPLFESRYALTSSLGSGGYGFVCVATELATRREVAVKFILASKIPPHAWVEYGGNGEEGDGMPPAGGKVPMECEVLRRVNHWGVVQGLGVFCDGKFFYLVSPPLPTSPITPIRPSINMERRGSCDLFECVERHKKFGEARARMIFKQIVDTVSYLSRIGIYHRDIKDENLVIDRDYRVKLIDFGSAVWERDPEHPRKYKEFFGTTAYASPEIITGHHYYAAEAEVWSLGILLCILVTGESPFHSPKEAQVGRRSPLRNGLRMSRELNDLIDRCLKVSPERRITIDEMRGHRWLGGGQ